MPGMIRRLVPVRNTSRISTAGSPPGVSCERVASMRQPQGSLAVAAGLGVVAMRSWCWFTWALAAAIQFSR